MLNIVLPIAGRGRRFTDAGHPPAPLLQVHGTPLIEAVVRSVRPKAAHHVVFVAAREHLDGLALRQTLRRIAPGCTIVPIERGTDCSVRATLMAREAIDNGEALLVAEPGQWVEADVDALLDALNRHVSDGAILTAKAGRAARPAVTLEDGVVLAITDQAAGEVVAGIYVFRHGRDFVGAAERLLAKARRLDTLFHLAQVCQELVTTGARLTTQSAGDHDAVVHAISEPADLDRFLADPASLRAVA